MERRALIQLVSLSTLYPSAVLGQHRGHCSAESVPAPYALRFFNAGEHALLQDLMDVIIPTDSHSPGARKARTADFADWMLSHSTPALQSTWRDGLQQVRALGLSPAEAISHNAANEAKPQNDLDRFFVRLKSMTVDGYYTTEIGLLTDLGYKGNQYLTKFEGCTHPEHQRSANQP